MTEVEGRAPEVEGRARETVGELISGGELEPADMARIVAELPEQTMREMFTDEALAAAADEIVRRFPDYVDAERTVGVHAEVEWLINDSRTGERADRVVVLIDDGSVSAGRELEVEPRLRLELDALDFLRLATGNANPATMFLSGRLGLSGDQLFALEMASFLRIPGADGEREAADSVDPARVDAVEIAGVVKTASDEALRAGMSGPIRDLILEEIFRRFPEYAHRSRVENLNAVIGFKITGRPDGEADRYRVAIADGTLRAGRDVEGDPRVTIVCDGVEFLKLVTDNINPVMAFFTGKLKIKGDLPFAAQIPGLFRIPTAAG